MKVLRINYNNDLIILGSPSHSNFFSISILLNHLYEQWKTNQFNTSLIRQSPIVNKILAFLPRLDLPKINNEYQYGIYDDIINQFDDSFFESMFLKHIDSKNKQFNNNEISKLLDIDVSHHKQRKKTEDDLPDIPNSTCGDEYCDLLVILSLCFNNSVKDAVFLVENYDSQFIYDFIYQFNEMNRDPKEKELEHRAEIFDQWKQTNQSTYKSYLGI